MKIDNSFSERRIYRARSKAGMDRDLVTKYFQCSKIYIVPWWLEAMAHFSVKTRNIQ